MNDLWQRPKCKVKLEDPCWYDNAPVGRDRINNVMKELSIQVGLIGSYTNHSIRSTPITALDSHDVEARHTQAVSGHKSESTIKTYAKKCSSSKKHQMLGILSLDKSSYTPPSLPKVKK